MEAENDAIRRGQVKRTSGSCCILFLNLIKSFETVPYNKTSPVIFVTFYWDRAVWIAVNSNIERKCGLKDEK